MPRAQLDYTAAKMRDRQAQKLERIGKPAKRAKPATGKRAIAATILGLKPPAARGQKGKRP